MSTSSFPYANMTISTEGGSALNYTTGHNGSVNSTDTDGAVRLSEVGALLGMVFITIIGALGNFCLIVVILASRNLRQSLTHAYVLNLACIDGVAAVVLLPLATVIFAQKRWVLGSAVTCYATGCLHVMLHSASILGMCVISAERFYSIAFPMRHSANLTGIRTGVTIALTWIPPVLFSFLPYFMSDSGYYYDPNSSICLPQFRSDSGEMIYFFTVTIFCFCIPAVIMGCMYFGILQVARKTAFQVGPIPGELLPPDLSNHQQQEETYIYANAAAQNDHNATRECVNVTIATISGSGLGRQHRTISVMTTGDQLEAPVTARSSKRAPHTCKAFRTLLLVYGSFLCLWLPYFTVAMLGRFHKIDSHYILITTWIGYASFALNPVFYGWLNRSIRDQMTETLREWKRRILCGDKSGQASSTVNDVAGLRNPDTFDFYQFLGYNSNNNAIRQSRLSEAAVPCAVKKY